MGLMGALFGNSLDQVRKAVQAFKPKKTGTEAVFRNEFEGYLETTLQVLPKREAGVPGMGTRLDLYFQHDGWDHIVTIKKGLSEQKVKTLLGEALILATNWEPRSGASKTHLMVVVFDLQGTSKEKGYVEPLYKGLARIEREDFQTTIHFCTK